VLKMDFYQVYLVSGLCRCEDTELMRGPGYRGYISREVTDIRYDTPPVSGHLLPVSSVFRELVWLHSDREFELPSHNPFLSPPSTAFCCLSSFLSFHSGSKIPTTCSL